MTGSKEKPAARPAGSVAGRASLAGPPGRASHRLGEDGRLDNPPQVRERVPLRKRVGHLMEQPCVEIFIVGLVVAYTLVIFTQILMDDPQFTEEYNVDPSALETLQYIDLLILTFFVLEVSIKVYAFGKAYFESVLYIFDAIIVSGSFIMSCLEMFILPNDSSLERLSKVKGVLRLLRIIIMFRKVSATATTVRAIVVSDMGFNITSPAERVLSLLNELKESREITRALRKDVMRAVRIIASNQLYEPVIGGGDESEGGGGGVSDVASAWINNASGQKAKPTEGAGRQSVVAKVGAAGQDASPRCSRLSANAEKPADGTPAAAGDAAECPAAGAPAAHGLSAMADASIVLKEEAVQMIQTSLDQFDFDIFAFDELCEGNALYTVAMYAVTEYNLEKECSLRTKAFEAFLLELQRSYVIELGQIGLPEESGQDGRVLANPYHSATHAADVTQTMLWMILSGGLEQAADLKATEFFGLVLAGCVHDFRHPGHNNVFCTKTRAPIAVRYNDQSVLEMHHIACAYELIHSDKKYNFFSACGTDSTYTAVREIVISTVCATDMSHHFSELGHFKSRIQAGDFLHPSDDTGAPKKEDKLLVMNVALHACDISNPAKGLPLYMAWTGRVLQEFFAQGDREKDAKLPVSMFMDRDTTNIAKCQLGFIDVLVYPLFDALRQVLPDVQVCTANLESNKAFWLPRVEQMDAERVNGTQRLPPVGEWNMEAEDDGAKT